MKILIYKDGCISIWYFTRKRNGVTLISEIKCRSVTVNIHTLSINNENLPMKHNQTFTLDTFTQDYEVRTFIRSSRSKLVGIREWCGMWEVGSNILLLISLVFRNHLNTTRILIMFFYFIFQLISSESFIREV